MGNRMQIWNLLHRYLAELRALMAHTERTCWPRDIVTVHVARNLNLAVGMFLQKLTRSSAIAETAHVTIRSLIPVDRLTLNATLSISLPL